MQFERILGNQLWGKAWVKVWCYKMSALAYNCRQKVTLHAKTNGDEDKRKQWNAFARKLNFDVSLEETIRVVANFIEPHLSILRES